MDPKWSTTGVGFPQVVQHMREGRTLLGNTAKPYPWMEYTMRDRTKMEVNVERVMTSCSFKTATACVLGTVANRL